MDGEPPNVLIPGILRVVPARVIDARGLGEQTAGAGLGAKREDVGPGNSRGSEALLLFMLPKCAGRW